MRTSLTEIRDIEKYLLGELPAGESLLFEARVLTNPGLRWHARLQQTLHGLLAIYQRKRTKEEVLFIHAKLFSSDEKRSFQNRVALIFNQ